MHFFYPSAPERSDSQINIWRLNGTKQYLKHYDNLLFLHFISKNPRATELEKRQARLEMTIAEKKLAFWSRHPNFDKEEAMRGVEALKRAWGSGERAA